MNKNRKTETKNKEVNKKSGRMVSGADLLIQEMENCEKFIPTPQFRDTISQTQMA